MLVQADARMAGEEEGGAEVPGMNQDQDDAETRLKLYLRTARRLALVLDQFKRRDQDRRSFVGDTHMFMTRVETLVRVGEALERGDAQQAEAELAAMTVS